MKGNDWTFPCDTNCGINFAQRVVEKYKRHHLAEMPSDFMTVITYSHFHDQIPN